MRPALAELTEPMANAIGSKLDITYDSAGIIGSRVREEEVCDVVIVQKSMMQRLVDEGHISAASVKILAYSGLAAAVCEGSALPDVSSVDAFKRALLDAGTVSCPDPNAGHLSGIHFQTIIEQLGVADILAAKTRYMDGALEDFAATDIDEIAITQPMEILAAPSYVMAGWLPTELQDENKFTWAVGISNRSVAPSAAKALVKFLTSPTAIVVYEAKGMLAKMRL